jgi:hypothetical protein
MSHNNPNGEKGTRFAVEASAVAQGSGFPHAEHRRARGPRDAGDMAGIIGVVVQFKDLASADLSAGLNAAKVQAANVGAEFYIYVKKRRGKHARQAYAVMPWEDMLRLLRMAGYGDPLPSRPETYEPGIATGEVP